MVLSKYINVPDVAVHCGVFVTLRFPDVSKLNELLYFECDVSLSYKNGFVHVVILFFVPASISPLVAVCAAAAAAKTAAFAVGCAVLIEEPCKLVNACKFVTSKHKPIVLVVIGLTHYE
jgi:hypothetical protein